MIGRHSEKVFKVYRHFRSCGVPSSVGSMLDHANLVGADPVGGFGRGGLVRLEMVERSSRRLVRGRT